MVKLSQIHIAVSALYEFLRQVFVKLIVFM